PRVGLAVVGLEDFARRQSRPSLWKAWMTWRTDEGAQPRLRASCWGVCPWALASRIWQRRKVKAAPERRPDCSRCRSHRVRDRTNRDGFIAELFATTCH